MNWEEAVKHITEYHASLGHRSALNMRGHLRYLAAFCEKAGRMGPAEVTESDIAAYQERLRWQPGVQGKLLSEHTVARNLHCVRNLFRWATRHRHVLLDPTRNLVIRRVLGSSRVPLSVEEVHAMLAVPATDTILGMRDRAVLETLYGTGVRRSECAALNLDDLDLATGTLTVRHSKNGGGRVMPVGHMLATVLDRYLRASRPKLNPHLGERALFLQKDGYRLPGGQLARLVKETARRAGLKRGIGPHDLRHAMATHLIEAGADVRMVQAILGHESLMSTDRYTHLAPHEAAKEFRDKHPRARRRSTPGSEPPPSPS